MMRIPNRSQVPPAVSRQQIFNASLEALDRGHRKRQYFYIARMMILVVFVAIGSFWAGRRSNQILESEQPVLALDPSQPVVQPISVHTMPKERYLVLAEGGAAGFWQEKMVLTMRKGGGRPRRFSGRTVQDWTLLKKQSTGDIQ